MVGPGPTHVYLIDNGKKILVDTGIPTLLAKAMFYAWRGEPIPPEMAAVPDDFNEKQLREGLALAGCAIKDIDALVISHGHPDHFLMGAHIAGQGQPQVTAHILDAPEISSPWGMLRRWILNRREMQGGGVPPPRETIETVTRGVDLESLGFSLKIDSPLFEEGPLRVRSARVRGIEVRHLPGHSPGSIGLIAGRKGASRVLVCGDVLLYPITPIPDDLLQYLRTLDTIKSFKDVALVLPAHGKAIRNVGGRIQSIENHHRRRLMRTYGACKRPCSVWDIATLPRYFDVRVDPRKFNPLAALEALAHMELLLGVDGLFREGIRGGIHYFQNSGEPFKDVYARIQGLVKDTRVNPIMRY
jgi:glyoxylase-like metal-dependent hydrolase (beta-lactamase superfamily II)